MTDEEGHMQQKKMETVFIKMKRRSRRYRDAEGLEGMEIRDGVSPIQQTGGSGGAS